MEQQFWDEQYKKDWTIGNKNFQSLYRVKQIKENDSFATIKEYLLQKGKDSENKKITELYEREIKLMKELANSNCENFVKFIKEKKDVYEEREDNYLYIIREYCFGNLEDFISMNGNKLEPGLIQLIMKQLNNAFKILRDKKIIHRNIKPSNILFCYNEDNNFIMKLSGLNYYKKGNESCPPINNSDFPNLPPGLNNENEKYDLWSIGIIMYFMYFGNYKTNKISEINDKDLKDLIEKCIKNTISWNDYFNHKFFTNNYSDYNDNEETEGIKNEDIELLEDYLNELTKFTNNINRMLSDLIKIDRKKTEERKNRINLDYQKMKDDYGSIDKLNENINDLLLQLNKNS